ncbi:MAG: glycosyltransferase [Candidatus Latescibacterota bacterium]
MPPSTPTGRVLVFNWHEPYICLLAATGYRFVVSPPGQHPRRRWHQSFRPRPDNVSEVAWGQAQAEARSGAFDLVVCLTLQDVQAVQAWDLPRLFVMLNMIGTDAGLSGADKEAYVERLRPLFEEVDIAFISEKKRRDWGWEAPVVVSGVDPSHYGGYTGELPRVLRVGNMLRERDRMQGFSRQEAILGSAIPSTIVGLNPTIRLSRPSRSWEDLKEQYRRHRVLLSTLADECEDGYNLAVLEAMATGMPVVCTSNSSTPIVDGHNGFVADDPEVLRARLRLLLEDRELAAALGRNALRTVSESFPIADCAAGWRHLFAECIRRHAGRRGRLQLPGTAALPGPSAVAAAGATDGATPGAQADGGVPHRPLVAAGGPARAGGSRAGRRLRILLAAPANPLSTSAYYERALRRGHEVLTCGPRLDASMLQQWQEWEAEHALKPPGAGQVEKMGLLARLTRDHDLPLPWGVCAGRELAGRLPSGWRPDLVVWIDAGPEFRLQEPACFDCPTVCLVGDTHTGQQEWRMELARGYEHTFLMFARQHIPLFAAAGCTRVAWLPAACEPRLHRGFPVAKAYDVVFVGQTMPRWHAERVRLLEQLVQSGLDVRVDSKVLEEMALLYSRGRMVFNRSLNGDLNMRVFEALASGSLLLTDRLPAAAGLEELFTDRRHLVLYGESDLVDVARYYLEHGEEREEIAGAGQAEVLAHHTYGHRADALLGAVFGEGVCAGCVEDAAGAQDPGQSWVASRGRAASPFVADASAAQTVRPLADHPAASAPAGRSAAEPARGPAAGESALPAYYRNRRPEVAALVPPGVRRVLEIGCAAGEMGRLLKEQRPGVEVVGVEVNPMAAAQAASHLDRVICADLESLEFLPFAAGHFDCITCGDVIEHLRDPEAVLTRLLDYLHPAGCLVCSIPNVRHQSVLLELVVNGRWQYRDEGLLDRTHLRFYTLAEVRLLVERLGLHLEQVTAVQSPPLPSFEPLVRAAVEAGGDAPALRREGCVIQYLVRAVRQGVRPRASIVIPVCNQAEYTEQCLLALAGSAGGGPEHEVLVVDNASDDWTPYLLQVFSGDLKVLRNEENVGFARACNQAAREARGEYLVFLNNDTVPQPGWLEALVRTADADARIGVVGARLLYPGTRRVQHAGLALRGGIPEHVGRGADALDPTVTAPRDLDMVTGACMLVRRSLFAELEGFDTGYQNGVEDVDLCLRARDRGWRVTYCPDCVVEHHEGKSQGRYDHVQENLQRFAARWQGRFGADGRFLPAALAAAADRPHPAAGPRAGAPACLRGVWEGPFGVTSSLAHVNRELVLALLRTGRCELGLLETEPEGPPAAAGERFAPLAACLGRLPEQSEFHLRHRWPPDFQPPGQGKLILMQPWEFGAIPRRWLEPLEVHVEQVWAYTTYVRQCYLDSGVDPGRLAVVPLGVDPERFCPGAPPRPLPTDRKFRFLFVGGTLYRKGVDVLLRAWRQAFSAADDVALVIKDMGTQTFYRGQTAGEQIRCLQQDPSCPPILYLTEDLAEEEMPGLYAACDCLVHPYRGEGFGLPVAEAMACGLPVIVTRGGACDDFCNDKVAYLLAAERRAARFAEPTAGQAWMLEPDADALAGLLRQVATHPQEARKLGQAASGHIRGSFTWAHAATRAMEVLEELCGRSPSRPGAAPLAGPPAGTAETAPASAPAVGPMAPSPPVSSPAPRADATPPSAPSSLPPGAVVLGGGADAAVEALALALGQPVARCDVQLAPNRSAGEQLEAARQHSGGRFLAVLGRGLECAAPDWARLAHALHAEERLAAVGPAGPDDGEGAALEPVRWLPPDCLLFRREALEAAGGFEPSFRTVAAVDEALRACRRAGWATARVRACRLQAPDQGPADPATQAERQAVRLLEEGDLCRQQGDAGGAEAAYRGALEAKPDFVEPIMVLGSLLAGAGRHAEAAQVCTRLVELDPNSFRAHTCVGLARYRGGDVEGARRSFQRAVELQPQDAEAPVNLAVLEWEAGNAEEAMAHLERAAALDPGNRDVIVNTALMQVQLGNVQAGAGLLERYAAAHPTDVEAQEVLLDVLAGQGDAQAALAVARRLLRCAPSHPRARALVERAGG